MSEEASDRANRLVAEWIVQQYREDGDNDHLRDCPDTTAADAEGRDGSYGCDTGCNYVTFDATISCPHGETVEFEYGEFGEMYRIIEDIEAGIG